MILFQKTERSNLKNFSEEPEFAMNRIFLENEPELNI